MEESEVGDIVEALTEIRRKDGLAVLRVGDTAKVTTVWRTTPHSPQIIGIELKSGFSMTDIVCLSHFPVRKSFHTLGWRQK